MTDAARTRPSTARALAVPALLALAIGLPASVIAQTKPPMAGASAASAANSASAAAAGNKATKPPVDAAASQADVATKKPAKPGAQSGAKPASAPR
jgi:hypothetical protein